jgi:hypothetical protein
MSHTHPTIKPVELSLGGQEYQLVFTFGALAHAQTKLRKLGIEANLLHALDLSNLTPDQVAPLLYAAAITHHPKTDYAQLESLVTMQTYGPILNAVVEAYIASIADPTPKEEQAPLPLVIPAES